MAHNQSWLPSKRTEQLAMAKTWERLITAKGAAWHCDAILPDLTDWVEDAEAKLQKCMGTDRTKGDTTACNEVFKGLVALMRDIKKRYFFVPPLTERDITDLGLNLPDTNPTPVADPTGQVTATVVLLGSHLLRLITEHVEGTPLNPKADYGSRIYWGIMPTGGGTLEQAAGAKHYLQTPPVSGNELPHSLFTRRRRELFDFPMEDSGKTVYFCIRYENSKGKAGPWGPIVSAIIP
jgi:hypothetical protein